MKLPRWLMILMLSSSGLAVLVIPAWWWVTWPTRTAREFVALLGAARLEDAGKMIATGPEIVPAVVPGAEARRAYDVATIKANARSIGNIIDGRQRFRLPHAEYAFTVRRGKVIEQEFLLGDSDRAAFTLPARPRR